MRVWCARTACTQPGNAPLSDRLRYLPAWSWLLPLICALTLAASWASGTAHALVAVLAGAALVGAVIAAVHHAEVVAHRVGEPYGTLILAVAVTIIEVGLIVTMMLAGGPDAASLARDTVFAATMIVSNGIVGLCLLIGGLRHRVQEFHIEGASSLLAVLAALATLALVLPTFTTSTPGPTYSNAQLAFVGAASLALYGLMVFVQTVRHRDYFLPAGESEADQAHARAPTNAETSSSLALLVLSLATVVGLAKQLAPFIDAAVTALDAPRTIVGIVIALLVLAPETWAAVRAAGRNRLQTSLNLALGSGLASIGLTIPTVAVLSVWLAQPLELGIDQKNLVLLALTMLVGTLTLGTGRTTVLQGGVHMVIFAAFIVLAFAP